MQRTKLLITPLSLGLIGTLGIGVTNAIVTPTVDSTNGDITVCGIEYVSDSNGAQ